MDSDNIVLCASSKYEEKFYLNQSFQGLPEAVKKELKVMCVLFTEDVGGILTLEFTEDGTLQMVTQAYDEDLLYDEIGSALKIKQIQETKKELFQSLELYYKVLFLQN